MEVRIRLFRLLEASKWFRWGVFATFCVLASIAYYCIYFMFDVYVSDNIITSIRPMIKLLADTCGKSIAALTIHAIGLLLTGLFTTLILVPILFVVEQPARAYTVLVMVAGPTALISGVQAEAVPDGYRGWMAAMHPYAGMMVMAVLIRHKFNKQTVIPA